MTASEESNGRTIDKFQLWQTVTGGRKKGRTIGGGVTDDPRYTLVGELSHCSQGASGSSSSEEVIQLRNELQQEQERRMELERTLDQRLHNQEKKHECVHDRDEQEIRGYVVEHDSWGTTTIHLDTCCC